MSDREDFEEAAARMGYSLRMRDPASEDGEYGDRETQCAWDMWQECCDKAAREQGGEPDWSESVTLDSEAWKNSLLSKNDRLQIADGAVAWRDEVIRNLRRQNSEQGGEVVYFYRHPASDPNNWREIPKATYDIQREDRFFENHKYSILYTHPSASVPEGWKLVPIEPTAEMSKAGVKVLQNTNAWATGVYQAMVEAARPTPAATAETDWVKPTGRHHELKTDYSVFQQSAAGLKPWEIRKNDRGFSVGDTVTLRETEYTGEEMADGAPLAFTGRTVSGVIGYVLDGPVYGLSDKWCIFTLQSTPPQEQ